MPDTMQAPAAPTLPREARRNLFLLTCCQAVGQAGNVMMFSATALAVSTFYPLRELSTLPVTLQHLGVMLAVFPAAMLMQRFGRSLGFRVGSLFGMAGSTLAGLGLLYGEFLLMCAGGLLLGWAVASLQMYRFAAVELAPPSYRAKAISWVTAGGVAAGVIGPALVRLSHDAWMPIYLGTYAAMVGIHVTVFLLLSVIRFPPPIPASAPATVAGGAPLPPPRRLSEIAAQPRFIVAVVSGMVAYGTMSFLMSASPLAIVACGLPHTEAHWVIFLHVMGMFVPSFFTGNLITRYGTANVMAWGVALLLGGIAAGLAGMTDWNFRVALTLNGIGWNFVFIGATTLVTTCYRPNERGKVQALNDFLVFGTTTTASFLAGYAQERFGWIPLNWASIPLMLVAVASVGWLWMRRHRAVAAA